VCRELSHAWTGGLELESGRFVGTSFDTCNPLRIGQSRMSRRSLHRPIRGEAMPALAPRSAPGTPAVGRAVVE
jgi:hypothetical protein